MSYTALPRKGSPEARANVELFLAWSRTLGLSEPDIFEPDDLIKVLFLDESANPFSQMIYE